MKNIPTLSSIERTHLQDIFWLEESGECSIEHRIGALQEPRSAKIFQFKEVKVLDLWLREKEDTIFNSEELSLVGIGFQMKGQGVTHYPGYIDNFQLEEMTFNLVYQQNIEATHKIFGEQDFHFFLLSFTKERFLDFISSSAALTEKYQKLFNTSTFYILHEPSPKITPALLQTIDALREIDLNNPLADMLAEAIIMSIIVHVHTETGVKSKEYLPLKEVREFLEEHYLESFTIKNLSKQFGINEFSLKKDFKAAYNHTIFGYVQQLRMEEAKRQLLAGKSIKEVAYEIGYEHPHHFSTAFRKWYNITPSSLR